MLCYHGTTMAAAKQILKTGFQTSKRVWKCSQSGVTYMVAADDDFRNQTEAISFAIEAAQLAAAIKDDSDVNVVLFQFDIPNEIFNELLPDISCANMDGCYTISNEKLNAYISKRKINTTAKIVKNAYYPPLRIFYLCDCDKKLCNITDELLLNAIITIESTDHMWFYDEVLATVNTNFDEMPVLTEGIDTD